jgi:hypothetical protein
LLGFLSGYRANLYRMLQVDFGELPFHALR